MTTESTLATQCLREQLTRTSFRSLPLEIRQKIYYITLMLQYDRAVDHGNEIMIYQWYERHCLPEHPVSYHFRLISERLNI